MFHDHHAKDHLESALRSGDPVEISQTLQYIYWQCFSGRSGAAGMHRWLGSHFPNRFSDIPSGAVIDGKRQPSQLESVYATLERLDVVESLSSVLSSCEAGLIVGGSLSYGMFYCVRGGDSRVSSDVDVIITVDAETGEQWRDALRVIAERSVPLFHGPDVDLFKSRIDAFGYYLLDGLVDIFSQKLRVKGQNFEVSTHFFSETLFDDIFGNGFRSRIFEAGDRIVTVRDFKAGEFAYPVLVQRDFRGRSVVFPVSDRTDVTGGSVYQLPVYIFREDSFSPGIYANVVSPGFHVWSDPRCKACETVSVFQAAFMDRWSFERARGGEIVMPHALHPRYPIFQSLFGT